MIQGPRNRKQTLNSAASIRPDMTLNAVAGKEIVEDQFRKLSNNRGIFFLHEIATMEPIIKIRYEACKAPMTLLTIDDQNVFGQSL